MDSYFPEHIFKLQDLNAMMNRELTKAAAERGRFRDQRRQARVQGGARGIMSLEQTACDDLKAFERRLTEVIACLQPATMRWRILLVVVSVCTAIAAWHWLTDPLTAVVSLVQSLWNHPFFFLTSILLVLLFMLGIHRRVIAPSIITARTRTVLNDFNMSCDETGKLILKPRPANS